MVLAWILASLALLAAASAVLVNTNRGVARSTYLANTTQALYDAAQIIRGKIVLCPIRYPAGDNGTTYNIAYPAGASATAVSALTCPGFPGANKSLWTGQDTVFLPPVPPGFVAWSYLNDATGVRVTLDAGSDADRQRVIANVAAKLGPAASVSGTVLTLWIRTA